MRTTPCSTSRWRKRTSSASENPGARTDQERREGAVVRGAGVEVGLDLVESEVLQFGATDRQFPGVVHGLRRQLAKLNEGDHLVHPAPDQLLVHACERHGTQARQQPLAAMRLEVFSR